MKKINCFFMVFMMGMSLMSELTQAKESATKINKKNEQHDVTGFVKWVGFGVGKSHTGTIAIKSGEVNFDKNKLLVSAEFILDMKSLNTTDSEKLKAHLRSADFFDIEKFSEARFKSTTVSMISEDKKEQITHYKVKGNLTIKDKTQPIEFIADIVKKSDQYVGKVSTEITDRTKYGIVYNSKQFSMVSKLGDKLIEDNIKLDIEVTTK